MLLLTFYSCSQMWGAPSRPGLGCWFVCFPEFLSGFSEICPPGPGDPQHPVCDSPIPPLPAPPLRYKPDATLHPSVISAPGKFPTLSFFSLSPDCLLTQKKNPPSQFPAGLAVPASAFPYRCCAQALSSWTLQSHQPPLPSLSPSPEEQFRSRFISSLLPTHGP